jgi:hypothetical protein
MHRLQQRFTGDVRLVAADSEQAQAHVGGSHDGGGDVVLRGSDLGKRHRQLLAVQTGLERLKRIAGKFLGVSQPLGRGLEFPLGRPEPHVGGIEVLV